MFLFYIYSLVYRGIETVIPNVSSNSFHQNYPPRKSMLVNSNLIGTYSPFLDKNIVEIQYNEKKEDARASIFYVNDLHGRLGKTSLVSTAAANFSKTYLSPNIDSFKVAAGDMNIGHEKRKRDFITEFLNNLGLDLAAIGNHETDHGTKVMAEESEKSNFKYVATNLNVDKSSEVFPEFSKDKLVRSCVISKNGHNYGFVGAMAIDTMKTRSIGGSVDTISIDDLNSTVAEIQEEINQLKQKGINKIIMLSHLGYKTDKEIASKVSGIDVIVGGHSHDKLEGIENGKNYVLSPAGEPVIIAQAGKNGEYVGILDMIFDSNGIIKSASNKLDETEDYAKDPKIEALKDKYLGPAIPIGTLTEDCEPDDPATHENPLAEFVLDAIRKKSGTQLIIENSGGIRGELKAGTITTRNIMEMFPFKDELYKSKLSEKDLIDALNLGARTCKNEPHKPGLFQVSGLRYTVTSQGTVKDVFLENPNGTLTRINHTNPDPNKHFTVCIDEYLTKGKEFPMLHKRENIIETFNWSREDAVIEYIKSFNNRPFKIEEHNRIKIEDSDDKDDKNEIKSNNYLQQYLTKPMAQVFNRIA